MSSFSSSAELQRSKRLALTSLILAVLVWLVLVLVMKFSNDDVWFLHLLLLSAEAGVVGGLADWYAVTVLFRNPFGRLPIPAFLRNHTEILPRNQARIAYSMGRFIQSNFLSPEIVDKNLQKTDLSLSVGRWLSNPEHNQQIVNIVQHTLPKTIDFIGQEQLADFMKENTIQWLKNTPINKTSSELLRAVLENDFHQEMLQQLLDQIHQWIKRNPQQVKAIAQETLKEMGLWKLAQGASLFGFDLQQRSVDALISKLNEILTNPEHILRIKIEQHATRVMHDLANPNSHASQRANDIKNHLLESPAVLNFLTEAVTMLCNAIKYDLQHEHSGIALHLQSAIQRFGDNLQENQEVRALLNQRLNAIAVVLSQEYGDKVIDFVSQQIKAWDASEMIAKIENAVGKDLHMIRVNGVIVGAMIGLILGLVRLAIEQL